MEGLDHRLELGDLLAAVPAGGVRRVWGEEADRVVAPVVGQPARGDLRLGDELVDRQQLDRGHAEVAQVVDDRRGREPGVRSAQLLGHPVVQLGHALDVQLVDDGVAPPASRGAVVAPVEPVVDDHAERHLAGRVEEVARLRSVHGVAEDRRVLHQLAADGPRVRVEQQLLRVEPQPLRRAPTARRPGSRSAVPAGSRAPRRARCRACARSAGAGSRCRRRRPGRGTPPTPPAPRPRSWSTPPTRSSPGRGWSPARWAPPRLASAIVRAPGHSRERCRAA